MKVLVLNPGSSSIKFGMFGMDEAGAPISIASGELSGLGGTAHMQFRDAQGRDRADAEREVKAGSMHEALTVVEQQLEAAGLGSADAVGYRVVHPGPNLKGHQQVTDAVLRDLKAAARFAPLHDPVAVELIEEMMRRLPEVPHVACFDTVFQETISETVRTYALPQSVRAEGVRRYGFHGLSCESVMQELRTSLGSAMPRSLVIAHLGSGCSVTAVVDGASVWTSMGLTPTGGVVMGTRPGDLDPGVVLYLLRREGATVESVEAMLNRDSGLKALGGVNDMRELRRRAAEGDGEARMAIEVFVTSVARTIAGEMVMVNGEAVVFTGGIGEHDAATRAEVCGLLRGLGIEMADAANRAGLGDAAVQRVSADGSRIAVYVAKADEDGMIARHVARMCLGQH